VPSQECKKQNRRLSGCVAVFVDQAAEDVDALDSFWNGQRCHPRTSRGHRNVEINPAMRPGSVVVFEIPAQDVLKVRSAPDQRPVQAVSMVGPSHPDGV
jgi:hypothetical protein